MSVIGWLNPLLIVEFFQTFGTLLYRAGFTSNIADYVYRTTLHKLPGRGGLLY